MTLEDMEKVKNIVNQCFNEIFNDKEESDTELIDQELLILIQKLDKN